VKPIMGQLLTDDEREEESARVVNGLKKWVGKKDGRWKLLHDAVMRRYKPVLGIRDTMDDVVTWLGVHRSLEEAMKPKGSMADRSFYGRSSVSAEKRVRQALPKDQSVLTFLSTLLDNRKKKESAE
jgi:hypothetical protein